MYKERIETSGNRIKQALVLRHMKQSDLCNLAKIPKSSLSLYLSGAYEPKQDRVYAMARVLGVSEAWLMGYDVPMDGEKSAIADNDSLTGNEQLLLDLFRKVPEEKQQMVLQMIKVALGNQ